MIGSPLTETINVLTDKLGYPRIDAHWGLTAASSAPRWPGSGPAAPRVAERRAGRGATAGRRAAGGAQARRRARAAPRRQPAVEPRRGAGPAAQRPAAGPAAQRPATAGEQTPPGLRLVVAHLLSGLAGIDDRFAQRWQPASQETFLVTVTSADTGDVVARWRVELRTRTITSADGVPATETTGARWEVVGTVDVWMRVAEGEIDLSLALRRRLLRYRDTGEPGPGHAQPGRDAGGPARHHDMAARAAAQAPHGTGAGPGTPPAAARTRRTTQCPTPHARRRPRGGGPHLIMAARERTMPTPPGCPGPAMTPRRHARDGDGPG